MRLHRTASILALGIACLSFASPVYAEMNAYLRLKGQKQGEIRGSVVQKGREGTIAVIAVSHEIVSPRDPASGLPTGKRMHKPFLITKEVDQSTPLLHNVLTNNENIPTFTLDFYRASLKAASGTGAEEKYLTITLTNANIASIRQVMLNNKNPELTRYAQYEEVALTYQKITWTWVDGGVTSSDDWESPNI